MEHNSPFESFEMQISQAAQGFLKGAAGWAMFLSIVGFVCLGFGLLGSFGIMAAGDSLPPGLLGAISGVTLGVIMFFFMILFFLPALYLFKFSTSTRQALNENSTEGITKAFNNLKSYFLWSGILTIIWIVSYVGFIAIFAIAAASMGGVH